MIQKTNYLKDGNKKHLFFIHNLKHLLQFSRENKGTIIFGTYSFKDGNKNTLCLFIF